MKKKSLKFNFRIIFLISAFLSFTYLAYAETVYLKSGGRIEGKVLEKTKDYIKIDFNGIDLTYYLLEDYQKAKEEFNKVLALIPADSEDGKEVSEYLKKIEEHK